MYHWILLPPSWGTTGCHQAELFCLITTIIRPQSQVFAVRNFTTGICTKHYASQIILVEVVHLHNLLIMVRTFKR